MALIMYLTRTPRYENITIKDIQLIESYFRWQHEKEIGSKYASDTFEKWCGHSVNELPNNEILEYFKPFYSKRTVYIEGIGRAESYSICEQTARLVKTNQIFNWFTVNVMNNNVDKEYYEVSKVKLEALYEACQKVKDKFTLLGKNQYSNENEYAVDEQTANELLPVMKEVGYFFGPSEYNELYADQIIKTMNIISEILSTTDFNNQAIYFNAIW